MNLHSREHQKSRISFMCNSLNVITFASKQVAHFFLSSSGINFQLLLQYSSPS